MKLEIIAETSLYCCRSFELSVTGVSTEVANLLRMGEVNEIRNYRRDLSLQLPEFSSEQYCRRASRRSRKPRSKSCNRSQKGTENSEYHITPCPDLIFIGINDNTS